jgi:hypothetical protein
MYNAVLSIEMIRQTLLKMRNETLSDLETPRQASERLKKDIRSLQMVLMELVDRL